MHNVSLNSNIFNHFIDSDDDQYHYIKKKNIIWLEEAYETP